jgi:hypothetical protein
MAMKNNILNAVLLVISFLLISLTCISQEKTKITPSVQLQYLKNTNDQRILKTSLTYSKNRMEIPVQGMEISFFQGAGKKDLIATAVTDNKGVAKIVLGNDIKLSSDNAGLWSFGSVYKGNDTIEAGASDITVKDVRLELSFNLADSIKTLSVSAMTETDGKEKPVSAEVVKIYVPRMFSLLPLGEITLDEKGTGVLEFPNDLPGDSLGNITVISKIEENATFGNVERSSVIKWGTPTDYSQPTAHRALWTKTAPRWMIYTLSVLLAGVWGHYLFAIISLIRIRIDAKRQAKKEYRA